MLMHSKGHEIVMSLSPQLANTLKKVNEAPFTNPAHPMVAALINSGHVTVNPTKVDPNDGKRVAVTLTASGHEANGTTPVAVPTTPVAAVATEHKETPMEAATTPVAMVAAVEKTRRARTTVVPEVRLSGMHMMPPTNGARRGGNRTEVYAFGKLEAPREDGAMHSFFVPATAENPRPEDTIRAAVSSANGRYKEKGGAVFKHFVIPTDSEFGVAGVRVFRIK